MTDSAIVALRSAEENIQGLAVPNKELAQALVRAALIQVTDLLRNNDVQAAIDVKDKLQSIERYIKMKVKQQQADLITQNTVAAGRLRVIREIGEWLDENIQHEGGRPKNNNNGVMVLADAGVIPMTSSRWQRVAQIDDQDFDIWVNENIETQELTFVRLMQLWGQLFGPDPADTPDLPDGKFCCIVIDPPWPIQKLEREVRENQGQHLEYPTMSLEQIAALNIPSLAFEDGCHLYLWVTQKYLPVGLEIMDAWGFNYECLMTWTKPSGFTPFSWMYNTEHVLFGRKGNLSLLQMGLKLGFVAPKGKHSEKPDIFYDMVRKASPEPRLELFARKEREGFTVWGNEVINAGELETG